MTGRVVLLTILTAVLGATPAAFATDPCVGEAKLDALTCKADCKEAFQLAKDNCRNRDHACMEDCRAVREECRIATGIDAALATCRTDLYAAKQVCRNTNSDPGAIDLCIDQAQVVAFLCRRDARLAAKPALAECRSAFRNCAAECPPPAVPSEIIDPVQCKLDAIVAYRACKADCREAFQVQKDLCLGRDHACVEVCRAGRDACREPIELAREAAIDACNSTRSAALANCDALYVEDSPEWTTCVLNAVVNAYQCRDAAREAAAPDLLACGTAFRTCAEACDILP